MRAVTSRARYNAAVACTATNVYIRLGFAKRIAQDKLNAEVTVVSTLATIQTAQIHWRSILGIAPVILLMVIIIVIYGVFRFCCMFYLYADFVRYPQCANWWLCGGSTVSLMDGHVRIILHSPAGRALLPASIYWDGVKFYADAVVNTADEGQCIAFKPPRRLALHLTKCGDALKIVGTSLDNIAIPAMGESITSVAATHTDGCRRRIISILSTVNGCGADANEHCTKLRKYSRVTDKLFVIIGSLLWPILCV